MPTYFLHADGELHSDHDSVLDAKATAAQLRGIDIYTCVDESGNVVARWTRAELIAEYGPEDL